MIWDRFDDAHDDVLKDIHKSEREIDKLKEQLKAAGVEFLPFKSPESGNESGPHNHIPLLGQIKKDWGS